MADSLKFGTSGLRGLAADLIGPASVRYASAFIGHLRQQRLVAEGDAILVGRDLRDSSPSIAGSVIAAIRHAGFVPLDCGALPTPALAFYALETKKPAVMVTGSHIPADRNGLKFYLATGEITKADEQGVLQSLQQLAPIALAEESGVPTPEAGRNYLSRYRDFLPRNSLAGWTLGVFQHSAVGRDDLVAILEATGAKVHALGRAGGFIPIDTEALGAGDIEQARKWVQDLKLDALISTDGDADRPLMADNSGAFIRGDVLGILTARYLKAEVVVTPVTSNSSIEGTGYFSRVVRTKVGSPFVIEAMAEASRGGARTVVGFEANGGVLLGSPVVVNGRKLAALPTRDALLPIFSVLAAAREQKLTLAELVATLPPRFARSDRLEHVPPERTADLLAKLADAQFAAGYFAGAGEIAERSGIDGLRFILKSGEVVHYRASGNAPELRCYTEASSADRAGMLLAWGLDAAAKLVR